MLLKAQLRWAGHISRMGWAIVCPIQSCVMNSPLATVTEGHQRNVVKTSSRKPSVPATLTTTCGRHLLLTARPGVAPSTRSSPPSRTSNLRKKIQGTSAAIPYQTFNCSCCSRICLPHIGLVSYQHACRRREQPPSLIIVREV